MLRPEVIFFSKTVSSFIVLAAAVGLSAVNNPSMLDARQHSIQYLFKLVMAYTMLNFGRTEGREAKLC